MKSTNLIIILLVSIFLFSACTDKLIEKPKAIVVENFYSSSNELQTAINGIFAPLKSYDLFGFAYTAQLASYSDFTQGRGSYDPVSQFQGLDNTNIGRIMLMWKQLYSGIRNANIVISQLTGGDKNISENDKNFYLAEARFMRAFIYFQIVRNWGKVVLRTEENMLEGDVSLTSESATYSFIEDDLVFAKEFLPETQGIIGMPTLGAAKTLLADVYFYQGKYKEARDLAREVINSGRYELVKVSTFEDFEYKLFGPDLKTSSEEIFYIKFSRETGDAGWSYVGFLNSTQLGYYNSTALWAIYVDTLQYNIYSSWDNRDIRKALWYSDLNNGANRLLPRKFIDPGTIASGTQGGNDYPFYRYADLLLLYAESECQEDGITATALEKLNMVKRRGYGFDPEVPSPVDFEASDFATKEDFIDTVIMERGYETFVEGKRWLDLKRSGKAKEIILKHTGKTIADKHFLWPFPVDEMNVNKAIKESDQNPGY